MSEQRFHRGGYVPTGGPIEARLERGEYVISMRCPSVGTIARAILDQQRAEGDER